MNSDTDNDFDDDDDKNPGLEIIGTQSMLRSSTTLVPIQLELWQNNKAKDLWIDRFDVRGLITDKKDLDLATKRMKKNSNYDEDDGDVDMIDLIYERYRDMVEKRVEDSPKEKEKEREESGTNENEDVTNTNTACDQNVTDESESKRDSDDHNHGGYKSNRTEIWTRPAPVQDEEYDISNYLSLPIGIQIPRTKKQFDIILHTCKNIREHGTQLEILLKVKHADENMQFDFLNHDSELFPFYMNGEFKLKLDR